MPPQVVSSIIGRGCRIGKGAHIEGSYLHDDVTVWEGARVESAMLCQGVTVMPKARIQEGVIVSFKASFPWHHASLLSGVIVGQFVRRCTPFLLLERVASAP